MTPKDKIKVQCRYSGAAYLGRRTELEIYDVNGEIMVRPCGDSRICKQCADEARTEYLARTAQETFF